MENARYTIISERITPKNGTPPFRKYRLVGDDGRLIDLRFRRTVNLAELERLICSGNEDGKKHKFEIDMPPVKISNNYEYPRIYTDNLAMDTLTIIY